MGRDRLVYAHRAALEATLGRPLGAGLFALHSCHQRSCCNPAHLREGTQLDNMADMWAARRGAHGERGGNAKLTAADVAEIRGLLAQGFMQREVAAKIGTTRANISAIAIGRSWGRA